MLGWLISLVLTSTKSVPVSLRAGSMPLVLMRARENVVLIRQSRPVSGIFLHAKVLKTTDVEQTWHLYDSQGQFLALSLRSTS